MAEALRVTEAKLEAAMRDNQPQPGGSPDDLAANLAKELGLTSAKVKAALEKLRPAGAPPQGGDGQAPPADATNS